MKRQGQKAAVVFAILLASFVDQALGQSPTPDTDAIARMMVANARIAEGEKGEGCVLLGI